MASRRIDLLFSDITFGCEEFGFIPRVTPEETSPGYENDDEDLKYQRYLKTKGVKARVVLGTIHVEE